MVKAMGLRGNPITRRVCACLPSGFDEQVRKIGRSDVKATNSMSSFEESGLSQTLAAGVNTRLYLVYQLGKLFRGTNAQLLSYRSGKSDVRPSRGLSCWIPPHTCRPCFRALTHWCAAAWLISLSIPVDRSINGNWNDTERTRRKLRLFTEIYWPLRAYKCST